MAASAHEAFACLLLRSTTSNLCQQPFRHVDAFPVRTAAADAASAGARVHRPAWRSPGRRLGSDGMWRRQRRTVAAPADGAASKGRSRNGCADVRRVRTLESHRLPRSARVSVGQVKMPAHPFNRVTVSKLCESMHKIVWFSDICWRLRRSTDILANSLRELTLADLIGIAPAPRSGRIVSLHLNRYRRSEDGVASRTRDDGARELQ